MTATPVPRRADFLLRTLVAGAAAAVVSAVTLAIAGRLTDGHAAGPLNGPSQWLWGEREAYRKRASVRHTVVGYAIHHVASTMWAALHAYAFPQDDKRSVGSHVAAGAATAALSYVVDYKLTPRRFQPGFEKHLRPASIFVVYSAFAVGLSVVPILRQRFTRRRR